jgi:two-component system, OmpR family, phosphate regulon response regulator PhoB
MKPARVLVVDDDRFLRKALTYVLCRHGYEVIEASDGEEGLAAIRESRPDLVYLDVVMPKIDGFEVTKLVRKDEELKNTRIVLLTAMGQDTDRVKGEEAGADDFLTKPFSPSNIIKRTRTMLGQQAPSASLVGSDKSPDSAQGTMRSGRSSQ